MSHPFGDLLTQYRARKRGLSQVKLAQAIGYDPAVIARMCQGQRDLTGPSGREKIVRLIAALHGEAVLHTLEEANALLAAASMPPLYDGVPAEAAVLETIRNTHEGNISSHANLLLEVIHRHHLPAPITTFVGRKAELNDVSRRLMDTRLLTLTGAGGCGKTRLALKVASGLSDLANMGDGSVTAPLEGIWWVELAPAQDEAAMLRTIARVLNVGESTDQPLTESIFQQLRDKHALLVLDNCEHILEACTSFVIATLQACPHLKILATSREPLNVMGETEWRMPGLSLQASDEHGERTVADSVQLFAERASAVNQDFMLGPHNAATITQICCRADGMPLAIELAAVQMRMLSINEIAAQLSKRFDLLATNTRMTLPRHQTLWTTIEWSDGLLTDDDRCFFYHLSVFVGGWTAEAAEQVAGYESTDKTLLSHLVSKSLVLKEERGGYTRYRMLEPIRQFALARLRDRGEEAATRQRHFECYLAFTEHMDIQMQAGMGVIEWRTKFGSEHSNLLAAMAWAREMMNQPSQVEAVLKLASAASMGWDFLGYFGEGLACLREAFDRSDAIRAPASASLRARALRHIMMLLMSLGRWRDLAEMKPACEACLAQCAALEERLGEAYALDVLGDMAWSQGDLKGARAFYEDSLNKFNAIDDVRGMWWAINGLTEILRLQGDRDALIAILEWSLQQFERLHDVWYFLSPVQSLAAALIEKGDWAQASALLEPTLVAADRIDDPLARLWSYDLFELADYPRALTLAEQFLQRQRQNGEKHRIAMALHQLGRILLDGETSYYKRAAALLDESAKLWRELGIYWDRIDSLAQTLITRGHVARCQGDFQRTVSSFESALRIARDANDMGLASWTEVWLGFAEHLLREDDATSDERGTTRIKLGLAAIYERRWTSKCVVTLALLSEASQMQGRALHAVTLAGAGAAHASEINLMLPHARRDYDRIVTAAQTMLDDFDYATAWARGQHMTLDQAVAFALQ